MKPHAPDPRAAMDSRRAIPLRAVPLALAALAVPGAFAMLEPDWLEQDAGLLLWLTPVLPAFLLAYYRGWRGAALALAFGMASLAVANVVLLVTGVGSPPWPLMLALVVVYLVITQGVAALTELLERERRAVEELALTDALTGLPNRREAERVLARGVEAARRAGDLSVVLFDLDHFKAVNDVHGHAVGDLVLREVADVLRRQTRGMDLSARFGGEEFLTVMPGSSGVAAAAFAQRVRAGLAAVELPCGPVTASAGVASFSPELEAPELLLAAADRALYSAKEMGRDRVTLWTEPTSKPHEPVRVSGWERGPVGVLVVDDDAVVERAVARALVEKGLDARPAGGARAALQKVNDPTWVADVLLTDVVMPEMSGPTLVEMLGRAGWSPPVVYMSGHLRGEVSAGPLPGGWARFVEKPLDFDVLAGLLKGAATQLSHRSTP